MGAIKFALFESDGRALRLEPEDDGTCIEANWGEGAASALLMLQRIEQRRRLLQPAE
jgi:hypothetical protein